MNSIRSRLFAILVLLLVAATTAPAHARTTPPALAACSWNAPGHNPFMGDVVAAVDAYQDIPAGTRARLQQRMASRSYDEVVRIRRDSIEGRRAYRSDIRDMHFGTGQRCASVDRSGWSDRAEERGLVYCEAGHCILVPTVCRNVSRIRVADGVAGNRAHADGESVAAAGAGITPGPQAADADLDGAAGGLPSAAGGRHERNAGSFQTAASPADAAALPLSEVTGLAIPAGGGGSGGGSFEDQAGAATPTAPQWQPVINTAHWVQGDDTPGFARSPLALNPTPALPVPEPATTGLMLAGLLLLAAWRRCVNRA